MKRKTKPITTLGIAAALSLFPSLVAGGCSTEQFATANKTFAQAKATGRNASATSLAASAATAQLAIYHLATALSRVARRDLRDESIAPLDGATRADTEVSYELDPDKATGRVIGERDGKRVVNLEFTYESEQGNAGVAYAITGMSGAVEGYQLFFPRLVFLYTAILGGDFQPKKDAAGRYLFDVAVEAAGSIGVEGGEIARLSDTRLELTYPFSDQEVRVGAFKTTTEGGTIFEGEAFMANKTLKLKGTIKDASGVVLFGVGTNAKGEPSLSPAASASPTASNTIGASGS